MKFQGKYRAGCQCRYCTGDNKSKAIHKSLKHRERQDYRKEEKDGLQSTDGKRTKRMG